MEPRKRFYVALALYAVIGLLIWMTIDDIPIPGSAVHITLRQLALGVLALIVLRTVLHSRAKEIRIEREGEESSEAEGATGKYGRNKKGDRHRLTSV